jgi:restriction endonuclease Mrr
MLPKYTEIERPLLQELGRRGGQARPADRDASGRSVYEALADHFQLTAADRAEVIYESGTPRSKWENMVRYAVRKLKDTGAIAKDAPHGVWALTDRGQRQF